MSWSYHVLANPLANVLNQGRRDLEGTRKVLMKRIFMKLTARSFSQILVCDIRERIGPSKRQKMIMIVSHFCISNVSL